MCVFRLRAANRRTGQASLANSLLEANLTLLSEGLAFAFLHRDCQTPLQGEVMTQDQFALLTATRAGEVWTFPSLKSGGRAAEAASAVPLESSMPLLEWL